MEDEKIREIVNLIARRLDWSGKNSVELFVALLTDFNFHTERKLIVPKLNELFHMNLNPEG